MPNVYPDAYHVSPATILSDAVETTCYTVPTGKWAFVQQITAAETSGAARTLTVTARKSSVDTIIVKDGAILANNAMDLKFEALHLTAADTIKCTGSAATIHVVIYALEISEPGH